MLQSDKRGGFMPIGITGPGIEQAQEVLKQTKAPGIEKQPGQKSFKDVMHTQDEARGVKQADATQKATQAEPLKANQSVSPLKSFVNSVSASSNFMNNAMKNVISGKPMSQSDLIMLQIASYKASSNIEIFGKAVEMVSNAAKQVSQTQV